MLSRFCHRSVCLSLAASLLVTTSLTGCQGIEQMGSGQKTGTAVGGVSGAVLGGYVGNRLGGRGGLILGTVLGGVIGAAIGNAIGAAYDEREKKIDTVRKEQKADIDTEAVEVMPKAESTAANPAAKPADEAQDARDRSVYVAHVAASEHFLSGSARPTEAGRKVYDAIADAYRSENKRAVLIVGHTDSAGDAQTNLTLSEARARAIGEIFAARGFSADNIYIQGAGEAEPTASNDVAEGRARNRRVEIVDGASGKALATYKQIRVKAIEKRSQPELAQTSPRPSAKPTVTAPAPTPSAVEEAVALPAGSVDFGGVPVAEDPWGDFAASQGVTEQKSGVLQNLFSKPAYAATRPAPPFLQDHSLQSGAITNLADVRKTVFAPDDCAVGYYRQPFYGRIGQHFVSISPISLMADGVIGEPAATEIYLNYDHRKKQNAPSVAIKGQARTYQLADSVLYRWRAADNKDGIIGLELRLPNVDKRSDTIMAPAKIYYVSKGRPFVQKTELQAKVVAISIKGVL